MKSGWDRWPSGTSFTSYAKFKLVGERGFEPPTPWSRTRCSTRLSHSPICCWNRDACSGPGGPLRDFVSVSANDAVPPARGPACRDGSIFGQTDNGTDR